MNIFVIEKRLTQWRDWEPAAVPFTDKELAEKTAKRYNEHNIGEFRVKEYAPIEGSETCSSYLGADHS
jgi:hypothetical protein